MDKMVGEKGKKSIYYVYYVPKSPYNSLRSLQAVSAYLFPNCTPIFIGMKQGKAIRKPVRRGKAILLKGVFT
jgi:hypothetical protein